MTGDVHTAPDRRETGDRRSPPSVGVQSVLFHNESASLERALMALARAGELAIAAASCASVDVHYGDCSASPCLGAADLQRLRENLPQGFALHYRFFGKNLGSARGHNELASGNPADVFVISNPDVVASPRALERMLGELQRPYVGMVEAKQLPIEHPKDYDEETGETAWASTAFAMIPAELFRRLGGFDADTFFLYCDDVDFSWRTRELGLQVIFQPGATIFHDKRLSRSAGWLPSAAERYYSAEAALLLSYKWSRSDLTENYLASFARSNSEDHRKAAKEFQRRRAVSALPQQRDAEHKIGLFLNGLYARHRFAL